MQVFTPQLERQVIVVAERIPYFTLNLLGITTCPFDVTLDDMASIYFTSMIRIDSKLNLYKR